MNGKLEKNERGRGMSRKKIVKESLIKLYLKSEIIELITEH